MKVLRMVCLRIALEVSTMDRISSDKREGCGNRSVVERMYCSILTWFGRMEKIDEGSSKKEKKKKRKNPHKR